MRQGSHLLLINRLQRELVGGDAVKDKCQVRGCPRWAKFTLRLELFGLSFEIDCCERHRAHLDNAGGRKANATPSQRKVNPR